MRNAGPGPGARDARTSLRDDDEGDEIDDGSGNLVGRFGKN
jgi:hypothetical protein